MPASGAGAGASGAFSSGLREPERARGAGTAGDSEAGWAAVEADTDGDGDALFFGISGMAREEGLGGSFLTSSLPTPARLA